MRLLCSSLVLLTAVGLSGAEPALTVTLDLPALRTAMPQARPSAAWWLPTGTPVRAHIISELERLLARDPSLPPRLAETWSATAGPLLYTANHGVFAVETPVAPPTAPLGYTWKADETLAMATVRRNQGAPIHLPFASWRNATASVASTWAVKNGDWTASTRIEGTVDLGLHALTPAFAHLAQSGHALTLAAGIEPKVVGEMILAALPPADGVFLQKMLGQRFDQAGTLFSGEVLFQGSAKPLPQYGLVTGLAPKANPAILAQGVADAFRGVRAQVEGALGAWTLDTPVGNMTLAWNKERLVVGNDPALLKSWLNGKAHDAAIPDGLALYGDADLPALAASWLPVGLALWQGLDLDVDALSLAGPRLAEVARSQIASPDHPKGLASALEVGHQLTLPQGTSTRTLLVGEDLVKRWIPEICGKVPVDDALAVYGGADPQKVAVVARTAAGWLILDECTAGRRHAWDAAGLAKHLAAIGCETLRLGKAPEAQAVIDPPLRVRLDRTWIPSLTGQVSAWRLEAKTAEHALTIDERGLPVAALAFLHQALWAELHWLPELQRQIQAPPPGPRTEL